MKNDFVLSSNLESVVIDRLENEESLHFISDHDKSEIAFVLLGVKPAFFIAWWEPSSASKLIEQEAHELESFLLEQVLFVRIKFAIEAQSIWCKCYCARDKDSLSKLVDSDYVDGDSRPVLIKKDKNLGNILGYPQTAVDAYISGQSVDDDVLPLSVVNSPEYKFVGFRMSKLHWKDEFDEAVVRVCMLKKLFPKLYQRIIDGDVISHEKIDIWNDIKNRVDQITDRLGMPVDDNIKDVVIGLNANGINTVASCGGHLDSDRLAFPWIGCAAANQPQYRYKDETQIKESIASRYNIRSNDIFNVGNDAAMNDYYIRAAKSGETEEYKKWDICNDPLEKKVSNIISEFYTHRIDVPEVKIAIGTIYPGCLIEIPDSDEQKWRNTLSENGLRDKIKEAQSEMSKFAYFLKLKYFDTK